MSARRVLLAAAGAAWLCLAGCVEDFDDATTIKTVRVLGARTLIDGDAGETRANPHPGETITIEWLVVAPEALPPLGWGFLICEAAPATVTQPICAGEPVAISSDGLSATLPRVPFEVPADSKRLLVRGIVCANEMPTLDEATQSGSCGKPDDDETLLVKYIDVTEEDDENHHPTSIESATITLHSHDEDVALPQFDEGLSIEPCTGDVGIPSLSPVHADAELEVPIDDADREDSAGEGSAREELELSVFTDQGELNRAFTLVDGDYEPRHNLYWNWPKASSLPEGGRLARLHFLLRDAHGGTAWTTRAICLVP